MKTTGKMIAVLTLALALAGGPAFAEKVGSGARTAHKADMQEILKVIRPANIGQVDRVSKEVFDNFFEQRNKIYNIGPAPAEKPATPETSPKRTPRNIF